jgi:hypothetical protein
VIYASGTSSFSVSSQALWQYGPSQLALATGLYSFIRGREEPGWIGLTGFSLAFAVICCPTVLLLVLPLGAYVLYYHRPQIGLFCSYAASRAISARDDDETHRLLKKHLHNFPNTDNFAKCVKTLRG